MPQGDSCRGEIFIVDDEAAVRAVLAQFFLQTGYEVACFADGVSLLMAARQRTPACIILDVNIPGKTGLDILKELSAQDYPAPIFIMSGQGDIPMAVEAIRNGALDFVEKPFRGGDVVARVRDAIAAQARRRATEDEASKPSFHLRGCEPLTRREQEVLALIAAGSSSKEAARDLGISPRAIEVHRAHIMEKLGARNAADLVRIALNERLAN
jgi:FixJ family two-component response regulator